MCLLNDVRSTMLINKGNMYNLRHLSTLIYNNILGINSVGPLVRVVPPLRLPRSVVGLRVAGVVAEVQIRQARLRAVRAVAVVAVARGVAGCPAERRGVGKEVATVFFEAAAAVVCGVLLRERHCIVAGGARAEWRGKRAALVVLWIHEEGVAGIERGEVLVAHLLCVVVRIKLCEWVCWNLPASFLFLR